MNIERFRARSGGTCLQSPHLRGRDRRIWRVSGQSGLHKAFKASLDYVARPFLKDTPQPAKETQTKSKPQIERKQNGGGFNSVGCAAQW